MFIIVTIHIRHSNTTRCRYNICNKHDIKSCFGSQSIRNSSSQYQRYELIRRMYVDRKPSNTNLIAASFVDSVTVGRPDLMGGVSGSSS
jgi:hypothetical protein